ncbi:hypothetical protein L9F63_018800 [Diploptera punctata]|uniref:Peptidase M13 N-terminal domain-containing protein n=1 Tax=Diploptera punctata TaxID=6984 RepID=A0AAD8EFC2_DIPPU|nr:hypothetical protein L9F63_018800 [Diploptera punctata]
MKCVLTADRITGAVNKEADPCENFYDYACGRWQMSHRPRHNLKYVSVFKQTEADLKNKVIDLLMDAEGDDPLPVHLAKQLFTECMKTNLIELLGLFPVKQVLRKLGLPQDIPDGNSSSSLDLTQQLYAIHYHLPVPDALFQLGITVHPKNETKKLLLYHHHHPRNYAALNIMGPDPESYLRRKKRSPVQYVMDELKYRTLILEIFEYEKIKGAKYPESHIRTTAFKTLVFEAELMRLIPKRSTCKIVKLKELQAATDRSWKNKQLKIDWKTLIQNLFNHVKKKIDTDYEVVTDALDFFNKFGRFFAKKDRQTVQLFIWWKVVDFLSAHGTRAMRDVRTINDDNSDNDQDTVRSMECIKTVENVVPLAVVYKLVTHPAVNVTKMKVEQMLSDIKESLMTKMED